MTSYKRMNSKKKSRELKLSLFPIPISQIEQQNCRIAGIKQLQNWNGKLGSINFPIAWLIWVHFCIFIFLFFQTDLKYVVKLLFFSIQIAVQCNFLLLIARKKNGMCFRDFYYLKYTITILNHIYVIFQRFYNNINIT